MTGVVPVLPREWKFQRLTDVELAGDEPALKNDAREAWRLHRLGMECVYAHTFFTPPRDESGFLRPRYDREPLTLFKRDKDAQAKIRELQAKGTKFLYGPAAFVTQEGLKVIVSDASSTSWGIWTPRQVV